MPEAKRPALGERAAFPSAYRDIRTAARTEADIFKAQGEPVAGGTPERALAQPGGISPAAQEIFQAAALSGGELFLRTGAEGTGPAPAAGQQLTEGGLPVPLKTPASVQKAAPRSHPTAPAEQKKVSAPRAAALAGRGTIIKPTSSALEAENLVWGKAVDLPLTARDIRAAGWTAALRRPTQAEAGTRIAAEGAVPAEAALMWAGTEPALSEILPETAGSVPIASASPGSAPAGRKTAPGADRRTTAGPEPVELAYGQTTGQIAPPPPEPSGSSVRPGDRPAGKLPAWAQRFFAENSGEQAGTAPAAGLGVVRNISSQAGGFPLQAGQEAAGLLPQPPAGELLLTGQAAGGAPVARPAGAASAAQTAGQPGTSQPAPGQFPFTQSVPGQIPLIQPVPSQVPLSQPALGQTAAPQTPAAQGGGVQQSGTAPSGSWSPASLQGPSGGAFQGALGALRQGPVQAGGQRMVEWTAPGWQPPTAPTQLRERPQSTQPAAAQSQAVHISEAEIRRTADRVYKIIEDRIRRERRRLGL